MSKETKDEATPGTLESVGATRPWTENGAVAIIARPDCKNSNDFQEVNIGDPRWREAMASSTKLQAAWNAYSPCREAAVSGLARGLRKIEKDNEADCGCGCNTETCCNRVGIPCSKCDARAALAEWEAIK